MKPLPLRASLPFYILPAALMALMVYWAVPALDAAGFPLFWAFMLCFGGGLGLLGLAAIIFAAFDRAPGQNLVQRLWLAPLRLPDIAVGVAAGLAGLWAYMELQFLFPLMIELMPWPGPEWLYRFRGEGTMLDVPLPGAWWVLAVYAVFFLANVVGEELWWRGYLLPRQQAALGRWAWLPHGVLWCGFHVFFFWDLVALLPIALMLSFVAQWRRSVWTGIAAHGVLNCMAFGFLWSAISSAPAGG
ncbi:MAG: CPBP family intramembrane metalloprotease [Maricaulaceae bacterium]|nr:CPBP family intramembrane metalloprotease [Maricaulaceae bacterium]